MVRVKPRPAGEAANARDIAHRAEANQRTDDAEQVQSGRRAPMRRGGAPDASPWEPGLPSGHGRLE